MASCPWCGERVERLYPILPGVVTRALVSAAGGDGGATGLEGCAECIGQFMDGATAP